MLVGNFSACSKAHRHPPRRCLFSFRSKSHVVLRAGCFNNYHTWSFIYTMRFNEHVFKYIHYYYWHFFKREHRISFSKPDTLPNLLMAYFRVAACNEQQSPPSIAKYRTIWL